MAKFSFSASEAPAANRDFSPLPDGQYEMMIVDSDMKTTKAGDGEYIELKMQVVSGEHSGRFHWERLNVLHPSEKAQSIARENLGAICFACGVSDLEETEQLHDIPFIAKVQIDRKDPQRNKIVGYKSAGNAPAAPAARPAPAAAKPARPWG